MSLSYDMTHIIYYGPYYMWHEYESYPSLGNFWPDKSDWRISGNHNTILDTNGDAFVGKGNVRFRKTNSQLDRLQHTNTSERTKQSYRWNRQCRNKWWVHTLYHRVPMYKIYPDILGSTNEIRNFCQKRSPRKPNNRFAKEAYCKKMLLEYESQFINLLDQDLPGFEDEPEITKMSESS